MPFVIKASYGNDSIALIQWAHENDLLDVTVLYNDTGWARDDWPERVAAGESWAKSLGFSTARTESVGLENLVRSRKGWPRQGIQFCTSELKIVPTERWLDLNDPAGTSVQLIGIRREESKNRAAFPEWSIGFDDRAIWAPLVTYTEQDRDVLLAHAGFEPLPHRSMECFPCINSNRRDLRELALDATRIEKIAAIEKSMGMTSKGKPRTMFYPYRYMGATGITEIVRWAMSDRGDFDPDDGNGSSGCEAGWCGL